MAAIGAALRRYGLSTTVVAASLALFLGGLALNLILSSAAAPPRVRVAAAARDLKVGDVLGPGDLTEAWAYWGDAERAYFVPAAGGDRLAGAVVLRPIPRGMPVPADAVLARGADGRPLAGRLAALVGPGRTVYPLPLGRQNVTAPPASAFRVGDTVAVSAVLADRAKLGLAGGPDLPLAVTLFPTGLKVVAVYEGDSAAGRGGLILLDVPADQAPLLALAVSQAEVVVHRVPPAAEGGPAPAPKPAGVGDILGRAGR
jgi:hypothetical protein